MSKRKKETAPLKKIKPIKRVETAAATGLTAAEVSARIEAGAVNTQPEGITPSVKKIVFHNTFTLFNLINVVLAIIIIAVGHIENTLFFGVAICNTAMGIIQEVRAKKTLDKLSILAKAKVRVVRDSSPVSIEQHEVVLDDIMIIAAGEQICADSVIVKTSGVELDESLLTGEADRIHKEPGDKVMSGSYVTSGSAYVRVVAVGEHNYANKLTREAKKEKKQRSQLMRTLSLIIRILTIVIVPLGLLLFYSQYSGGATIQNAVLGASAAMIGMIPEGLVLLTGVTLTLGALNLARKKALVQSLQSIETLARVDVLCLDKTGTITDGTMKFEHFELLDDFTENNAKAVIAELMGALKDENATATALKNTFGTSRKWRISTVAPFSSERKWSGVYYQDQGSYVLGAPNFIFKNLDKQLAVQIKKRTSEGYRVLCIAHSAGALTQTMLPENLVPKAFILLSDTIRAEAPETFAYFEHEGVILKVISGDDANTVRSIAMSAGIKNADKAIDMSTLDESADLQLIAEEYTVFGRVSPMQKKALIEALNKNGHTTCMTGDGVNDVPAMKTADCSVAMVGGSDAARGASDFVLMTSNFAAMVDVLKEGRRVINNIEKVASLYLVKTIYSTLLTLFYIFLPFPYPFAPLQMTPINFFTIGIPSFLLALRGDYRRPEGRFGLNILENALPAALTVVINILILQLAGHAFSLSQLETSTMQVLLTACAGFVLLARVSRPMNTPIRVMNILLLIAFFVFFIFLKDFFMLGSLFTRNAFFYIPLLYATPHMFRMIRTFIKNAEKLFLRFKNKTVSLSLFM